jgi:cobalamin biosynthetic protein CobC
MAVEGDHTSFFRHGGNLAAARAAFPSAPLPWIDLSTGVNPIPWEGPRTGDLTRLPDPADIATLEKTAARAFDCAPDSVVAIPGADIGIRLLPHLFDAKRVAIVSPTYCGHRQAWVACEVREIGRDALSTSDADVLVVTNPNNPDGTVTTTATLLALAERQRKRGGWLIVDESFADVAPENSVAGLIHEGLIVLRSFGKFFGLPGVRLGFIVADRQIRASVHRLVGDWPVNAQAIAMGIQACADRAWQDRTRKMLAEAMARLDVLLTAAGFAVVGGTPLFRLAARPDAQNAFRLLAQRGILVRPFEYNPTWLRFGLPPTSAWDRVTAALREC